ncbi:hypothetical protein LXL04_031884 [Taraxacum kok-saghyz]
MNLTKRLINSIRLANSLYSTHPNTQVRTRFPDLHVPNYVSPFLSFHAKLLFSSKPEQTLNLITSEKWSAELEQELVNSKSDFTHETVMYILKKLSKEPQKASDFFKWIVEKQGFQPSSFIYSLMLRVYGNKESIKQFWVTAQKMKEGGFFIDDHAYLKILHDFKSLNMTNDAANLTKVYNSMVKDNVMNDVIKEIATVVIESDWGNGVEKKLAEIKFDFKVTDDFVLRVLKDLRRYPLKAINFFGWVSETLNYEQNSITYNGILRVICHEDSIKEFWNMFNEMKKAGHEMDLDTYLKISRFFQKRKMLKEAVELYEHIMDSPYKPSIQDCSVLLRTLAGNISPNLDLVYRVVNKFKSTGNSLSKSVYDGIHRSLTSVGQFDEAEKITTAMKEAGYEPDNITYSQLIFGLCKSLRLEDALQVLDEMQAHNCTPDIKTWTILIKGHCSANEVDKALIIFADMIEKGGKADADLLDVLVTGFLTQNKTMDAHQVLVEMIGTGGVKPWQATYKNLIQKLLMERKFEESLKLLKLMKKHDYPPFSEPFVVFVSKFGTIDDALEFLKTLSFTNSPSVSAYQNVFQGFVDEGIASACDVTLIYSYLSTDLYNSIKSCEALISPSKDRNTLSFRHGPHTHLQNAMKENIEPHELEIVKAVAQAWLGHTTTTSPPSSTNEFDTRRLCFKNKPTRFQLESISKPSWSNNNDNRMSTSWDFTQSLWDSYEIVAVSRRLESGLFLDNEFDESSKGQSQSQASKRKKESKNSLRNVLNRTSSRSWVRYICTSQGLRNENFVLNKVGDLTHN